MSNAEIFQTVGHVTCQFVLSLLNLQASDIAPSIYQLMVIFISLFIWLQFLRLCWAIVKRFAGFRKS